MFGSLDGLLVPLGVVSGVAGGTASTKAVIVAGLAEAFAGAISMGAGEFIAGQSEAQVQKAEIQKEMEEMQRYPEYEFNEMIALLKQGGVKETDAPIIAEYLRRNPQFYAKTMVAEELGISTDPQEVKIVEGITMALSYIIASIVPLIAYFFLPIEFGLLRFVRVKFSVSGRAGPAQRQAGKDQFVYQCAQHCDRGDGFGVGRLFARGLVAQAVWVLRRLRLLKFGPVSQVVLEQFDRLQVFVKGQHLGHRQINLSAVEWQLGFRHPDRLE